jgi:TPR repeat protein
VCGQAAALLQQGVQHYQGTGVEVNRAEAARLWHEAAVLGLAGTQYLLGSLYEKGDGVKLDYEAAALWHHKSAEQGHEQAQHSLGRLYEKGNGVKQDYEAAAMWYRKAVEQGDAKAQYYLGFLHKTGHGVKQDQKEATRLFKLASAQGLSPATAALAQLASEGEQSDLQAAKELRKKARKQFQALPNDQKAQIGSATRNIFEAGSLHCSLAGCNKVESADPSSDRQVRLVA